MNPGRVVVDVVGTELTSDERDLLMHPEVGGVILFSRNFESRDKLRALTASIRDLRKPELLITLDHEGGRVQRFREGYTRLPTMRSLGEAVRRDRASGLELARAEGRILAAELLEDGVDLSFTPVLDLDFGRSAVIGDRAFSGDPALVGEVAGALVTGLADAGMASVGKHFPGHGWAEADSHVAIPVDERGRAEIERLDLEPYRMLIPKGLAAIMPAHVIYPAVDSQPAGFSPVWLRDILRERLGFDGLIFSDDLTMEGASVVGGVVDRARAAIEAGCDMVLVCNRPDLARELVDGYRAGPVDVARFERLRGRNLRRPATASPGYTAALALHENAYSPDGERRA